MKKVLFKDNGLQDNLAPGQFGTRQFDTGQFGTRTIWHRIYERAILHKEITPNITCSLQLSVGPGTYSIFLADAVKIVRGEFFVMCGNFKFGKCYM